MTGDEEMTGAQQSYLQTLAEEAHEPIEPDLTKAEASKEIDRLLAKRGRFRNDRKLTLELKSRSSRSYRKRSCSRGDAFPPAHLPCPSMQR